MKHRPSPSTSRLVARDDGALGDSFVRAPLPASLAAPSRRRTQAATQPTRRPAAQPSVSPEAPPADPVAQAVRDGRLQTSEADGWRRDLAAAPQATARRLAALQPVVLDPAPSTASARPEAAQRGRVRASLGLSGPARDRPRRASSASAPAAPPAPAVEAGSADRTVRRNMARASLGLSVPPPARPGDRSRAVLGGMWRS